jgi:hypothetical protein
MYSGNRRTECAYQSHAIRSDATVTLTCPQTAPLELSASTGTPFRITAPRVSGTTLTLDKLLSIASVWHAAPAA